MTTTSTRNTPFAEAPPRRPAPTFDPFTPIIKPLAPMAVGDIESDAQGSGARANGGKPQMDLIPIRFWLRHWCDRAEYTHEIAYIMENLGLWQVRTGCVEISNILAHQTDEDMDEAVRVFEFGAKKYAAWNWSKGMAWSVPVGCILRHIRAIMDGQEIDPDSGCKHMGHVICNLIMLAWFATHYEQGDDRPPVYYV